LIELKNPGNIQELDLPLRGPIYLYFGAMDILVFDDDPMFAEMACQMARGQGFTADSRRDAIGAIDFIREKKPRMVILDVMLPGFNGFTLCRSLRKDPVLSQLKIILCTGKTADETETAQKVGADAFIRKSKDVARLGPTIKQLLGDGPSPEPAEPEKARKAAINVAVWGTGDPESSSAPGRCVSVHTRKGLFLFDAGISVADLARKVKVSGDDIWVLLSRCHPGTVAGLSSLVLLGKRIILGAPQDPLNPIDALVADCWRSLSNQTPLPAFFPVWEASFTLWKSVLVRALYVNFPGLALAYRVDVDGRILVYCPDNELESDSMDAVRTDFTEKLLSFIRGADLLIHDARDKGGSKGFGKGHSPPSQVLKTAMAEGVRRLALWVPGQTEEENRLLLAGLNDTVAQMKASIKVEIASPRSAFSL